MANVSLIIDPDSERRAAYLEHVRKSIAPFSGLSIGEANDASFHAVWACGKHTPHDVHHVDGTVAVVWGRAMPRDSATPVSAADAAAAWTGIVANVPKPWDGYFAAAAYDESDGLVVGVDVLGFFPMYWWSSGNVTLCATSPAAFRHHPLFQVRLDRLGLTGILLTMHSLGGRTLLEGVHRLRQGHLLYAPSAGAAREIVQYRLPTSDKYFDMPLEEHIALYDDALDRAVRRHIPADTPHTLLMSGGMDSRMVTGYLARHNVPTTALTFGHRRDIEMRCARAVASAVRFEHRSTPAEMRDGVTCAELHVQLLQATSSPNSIEYWGIGSTFDTLPKRFTAGYVLDAILSGYIGLRPYSKTTRTMAFDHFAPFVWEWGVAPDILRRLLAFDDADALVDAVVDELRATYEAYHELESRRYWAFVINHRQRFHVGQIPWMFSFHAWPAMLACDQTILETAGGMPTASLDERLAQVQLICRRFPELARLPLDRNSMDDRPLIPNWKSLLKHRIQCELRSLTQRQVARAGNRNYYQRVYDFNDAGWCQIRRHAEPYRAKWKGILNIEVLNEFLPPPDAHFDTVDVFAESSGRKVLTGLSLWARDYL